MQAFVTGGTGFIGQPLSRALLARGWTVTVLVRRPESSQVRALTRLGARPPVGDVSDPESMRAAMRGAQLVVHDAGHYEYGVDRAGMRRMRAVNVASPSRDRRLSRGPRATQPRPRVGVVRRIQSVPR